MPPTRSFSLFLVAIGLLIAVPLFADVPLSAPRYFAAADDFFPAIAGNGTSAMAVWARGVLNELYARPVAADGKPLLPSAIPLPLVATTPAIASNGDGYLVVAGGLGLTTGVRLDAEGNILDRRGFVIHPRTRSNTLPHDDGVSFRDIAWDGERYVVTSTLETYVPGIGIERAFIASTVGADGHVLQPEIVIADQVGEGVVAAKNGVSLIAWANGAAVSTRTLQGAGAVGQVVTIPAAPIGALSAAATADGFVVVWNDGSLRAQRFDPGGAAVGLPMVIAAGPVSGRVAVTPIGAEFEVAWSDGTDILLSRVQTGVAMAPQRIGASQMLSPGDHVTRVAALTAIGATTVVDWTDSAGRVVAREAASTSDPSPLDVGVMTQFSGAMIFDGSNYFAAWVESPSYLTSGTGTILVGRITPSGQSLDGSGIAIADQARLVGIFRGDETHLILWNPVSSDGTPLSLNATLVSSDGQLRTPPLVITSQPPYITRRATAVWNGSSFLVTWFTDALYAIRISSDGRILDSVPMRMLDYPVSSGVFANGEYSYVGIVNDSVLVFVLDDQLKWTNVTIVEQPRANMPGLGFVDIATDGNDYFVVWWRGTESTADRRNMIGGQLVAHGGSSAAPAITIFSGGVTYPPTRVVWDGGTYEVAWNNISENRETVDLMLSRFARDGAISGPTIVATVEDDPRMIPFISVAPGAMIYGRVGSTAEYKNVRRLFFRTLTPPRRRAVR